MILWTGILPLLTNLVIFRAWWVLTQRGPAFYIECLYLLLVFTASNTYHTCLISDNDMCWWSLVVHRKMDHILAEGTLILTASLFAWWDNSPVRHVLFILTMVVQVVVKVLTTNVLFAVGATVIFGAIAVYRHWRTIQWTSTLIGCALFFIGFIFYILEDVSDPDLRSSIHAAWHIFAFIALEPLFYGGIPAVVEKSESVA